MPLENVTLYACRALKDISPLKNANLRNLNIGNTAVGDLSPLRGQPPVNARLCTNRIADTSPLGGLTTLKILDLTYAKDISPLKGLVGMDDLRLDFISVSDLSPVRSLAKLRIFSVMDCSNIKDLSPIKDLPIEAFIFTRSTSAATRSRWSAG